MIVDIKKSYRAKNGAEVRLFADDGVEDYEIIGAIKTKRGWEPHAWSRSGKKYPFLDDPYDLIEIKPRIRSEVWVNIYENDIFFNYNSRSEADVLASPGRLACVRIAIDYEEGEGL